MAKQEPNPRDVMLDRIEASRFNKRPSRMISVNWNETLYRIVKHAAEERGISMSAYVRRAAAAMACYDLGLDYYTVMKDERGTRGYGQRGGNADDIAVSSQGRGFGLWEIKELEDERPADSDVEVDPGGSGPGDGEGR